MLVRLLALAVLCLPALARADDAKGEIDWSRRVIKARGQGAPDLSAPSISVARLGAERAAKADAMRNLLETLKGATVESGARMGTLLQDDKAMLVKVQGALRGYRVVPAAPGKPNPHYYSDGGVAIDVELAIDTLPPELAKALKVPEGAAAVGQGKTPAPAVVVIVDISGLARPGDSPRLLDEADVELVAKDIAFAPSVRAAQKSAGADAAVIKALRTEDDSVVIATAEAARLRQAESLRVLYVF